MPSCLSGVPPSQQWWRRRRRGWNDTSSTKRICAIHEKNDTPKPPRQKGSANNKLDTVIVRNQQKKTKCSYHYHLFSLQAASSTTSSTGTNIFCKCTNEIWKWKDEVLGDGRDFFIPRPKTLQALQQYLMRQPQLSQKPDVPKIEECMILSNCARFEIYLVTSTSRISSSIIKDQEDDGQHGCQWLADHISRRLVAQCQAYQQNKHPLWDSLLPWDAPRRIDMSIQDADDNNNINNNLQQLQWTYLQEPRDICRHLCLVAAGLAMRPNRPERVVLFRPFSSRDAHVLLQLKRTLTTFSNHQQRRLVKLVQSALQAGKAARNIDQVPELAMLRPYGTGDSSHYDSTPPAKLLDVVKQAVLRQAIDPIVDTYAADVRLTDNALVTDQIAALRQTALALAHTPDEIRWIKQQLHAPTVALRQSGGGESRLDHHDSNDESSVVNVFQVVSNIQEGLLLWRQQRSS